MEERTMSIPVPVGMGWLGAYFQHVRPLLAARAEEIGFPTGASVEGAFGFRFSPTIRNAIVIEHNRDDELIAKLTALARDRSTGVFSVETKPALQEQSSGARVRYMLDYPINEGSPRLTTIIFEWGRAS